jgi:hypothetical protein
MVGGQGELEVEERRDESLWFLAQSAGAAGTNAQCHLVIPLLGMRSVVGRTPWSAADALVGLFTRPRA